MKSIEKHILFALLFILTVIIILPGVALANAAEPPAVIILVSNPPEDLSIVLKSGNNLKEAKVQKVAWEGYYAFYIRDTKGFDKLAFQITTKGETFEILLDTPLKQYNNIYTLDLNNKTLTEGEYPLRSALLVSIRVLITLLVEGMVFWLFKYRKKASWLIFLAVNLITQGLLNTWLVNTASLMSGYLIIALIIGEFFVFAAEMVAFPVFVREHRKSRALAFSFVANLLSFAAGSYLITYLPV